MMLRGTTLHPGRGAGESLVLQAPLSFWGGTDEDCVIVDEHHPQRGACLAGRVVVMRAVAGSSSSSSVLAEQIRAGTAPAALILGEPDAIVMLGAWVARELYGPRLPIVVLDAPEFAVLAGWPAGPVTVAAGPDRAIVSRNPGSGNPGSGRPVSAAP